METCFLSSNSFTKTIEFVPCVKSRALFSPKKIATHHFPSKRIGLSSSITCCHLSSSSSSSPPEEDKQPYLEADWRSFRARLVANEQVYRLSDEPSSLVNPDVVIDAGHSIQVTVGDKWVHPIYEPEKGCILIATEKLDGVHIFEQTVILLLSVGPVGPYGIILNRPSLMSIKEIRSTVMDDERMFKDKPLFFGGPMEEGLFLVSPKRGFDNERVGKSGVFEEVMKGLYFGTKESVGCAAEMVKRNVVSIGDFRFFDGYCRWDKEQLREEINGGYWTVAACSPSVIVLNSGSTIGLWHEILSLINPRTVW